jgi:hypothetical protein
LFWLAKILTFALTKSFVMLRASLLFFFLLPLYHAVNAQFEEEPMSTDILLRKEYHGGAFISTAGAGLEFRKGVNTTFFTKWMYEANLLELKSSRETRIAYYRNARSYVFGKLNNFYVLRAGGGQQKLLNRKPYWGGVEVRYFWFAGGSLGVAKPVYLYIFKGIYPEAYIAVERYDPDIHQSTIEIYGRAPFAKGFESLTFHPGAYVKAGFSFDIARQSEKVSALEIGAALDIFPTGVPLMAMNSPERYFLTLFVGYYIGKRYN